MKVPILLLTGNQKLYWLRRSSRVIIQVFKWLYWRGVHLKNIFFVILFTCRNELFKLLRIVKRYSNFRIFLRNMRLFLKNLKVHKNRFESFSYSSLANIELGSLESSNLDLRPSNNHSKSNFSNFLQLILSSRNNVTDQEIAQTWYEISLTTEETNEFENGLDLEAILVLHVHYLDIGIEILDYISSLNVRFRQVIVTTTSRDMAKLLYSATAKIAIEQSTVIPVDNSFRDARPFLIAIKSIDSKLPVLKLHTKKSPHLKGAAGESWRRSLIQGLIPHAKASQIFSTRLREETVPTIICPAIWVSNRREWGRNDFHVFSLCIELGIPMKRMAPFPKGNMFWMNSEVVKCLNFLSIPGIQAESEKHFTDSTWAHGLERFIGQIVINGGRGYKLHAKA